jgi:caffeoyl-CoA O-methyltransferase
VEIVHHQIEEYIENNSSEESEVLKLITRNTFLQQVYPRMISGKLQGKFLEMFSLMMKPDKILEIGTFTAYATVCLARGLSENGSIVTIEVNAELEDTISEHIQMAGIEHKTKLIIGNALNEIPKLNELFDLVFIDGDKEQYSEYFASVLPFVKSGGYILADNVLWGGKVIEDYNLQDKETKGIMDFNRLVAGSNDVEVVMLPLRDGVSLIRKK